MAYSRIQGTFRECLSPGMNRPHGVIVHNNRYIVTDTYNHRVISIDRGDNSSRVLCRCTQPWNGDRRMKNIEPYAIVALSDTAEHFLFTDIANGSIIQLKDGQVDVWYEMKFGEGKQSRPTGIAVDKSGKVFVADSDRHCIHVIDQVNGLKSFGQNELCFPWFIAFNSQSKLYVADDRQGIKVFNNSGEKLETIKVRTDNATWHCRGIAIDGFDNIFVTIRTVGSVGLLSYEKVMIYNRHHKAEHNFGGYFQFSFIRGISFDYKGNSIIVVDGERNRLQRYSLYKDPAACTNLTFQQWNIFPGSCSKRGDNHGTTRSDNHGTTRSDNHGTKRGDNHGKLALQKGSPNIECT